MMKVASHWWKIAASSLVIAIYAWATWRSSAQIDGHRYFWLNDDQMISMRYARNLADGHGLVWNPGERVEGITNPGWTLVMAIVHLFPIGDAHTSLAVRAISLALTLWVLWLSERLLIAFKVLHPLALPATLFPIAVCIDVVGWGTDGFETPLLTALFLLTLVRLMEDRTQQVPRASTFILVGVLPLVRTDAFGLLLTSLFVALSGPWSRQRVASRCAISLAMVTAMFLARRAYYGTWLPNTYYLKVVDLPQRWRSGAVYVASFVSRYAAVVVPWVACTIIRKDRMRTAILAGFIATALLVASVGGDMFQYGRFLAPFVPLMMVMANVCVFELANESGARAENIGYAFVGFTSLLAASWSPHAIRWLYDRNPPGTVIVGLALAAHTGKDATVGLFSAGNTAYFARRRAIDFLGKCDAHVARTEPHPGMPIGHNKYDFRYSLSLEPDYIVFPASEFVARHGADVAASGLQAPRYAIDLSRNDRFAADYASNPVALGTSVRPWTLFVSARSTESRELDRFRSKDVDN